MYGDTAAGRKRVAQLRDQSGDIRAAADLVTRTAGTLGRKEFVPGADATVVVTGASD